MLEQARSCHKREGSFLPATESPWAPGLKGPLNYRKGSKHMHKFKRVGSWVSRNLWIFPKSHPFKVSAAFEQLYSIFKSSVSGMRINN